MSYDYNFCWLCSKWSRDEETVFEMESGHPLCGECRTVFRAWFLEWDPEEAPAMPVEQAVARVREVMQDPTEMRGEPLQTRHWWFLPIYWIGCQGYIVDKRDGNVLRVGSARSATTKEKLEAYDYGFRYDLIDLTITEVLDTDQAVSFLLGQSLWHNPKEDVMEGGTSNTIIFWTEKELREAIQTLPCLFRSQRLHASSFLKGKDDMPFRYQIEEGT